MATLRERPYVQFNFLVDLGDGVTEGPNAGFQELSGIGMEVTVSEYRTGNHKENSVMKITSENEIRSLLNAFHLDDDTSLSVLAVEMMPRYDQYLWFTDRETEFVRPLSTDLGQHRILRTSPPVAAPEVC